MPINREPHIYSGYVISMIGQTAGQRVDMDFKNAQACVACGTHRWEDDETDMPLGLQAEIDAREAARLAQEESDRIHNAKLKAEREAKDAAAAKSVDAILLDKARKIGIAKVDESLYLTAPFPAVTAFTREFLDSDDENSPISIVDGTEGDVQAGDIVMNLSNAIGRYRPLSEADGVIVAQLQEAMQPEVNVPADWREMSHLQTIPLAKLIRGNGGKMTKADATAILDEWTKPDDQVPVDETAEENTGAQTERQGTDAVDGFKDKDGNAITPAERADEAAKQFAADQEND